MENVVAALKNAGIIDFTYSGEAYTCVGFCHFATRYVYGKKIFGGNQSVLAFADTSKSISGNSGSGGTQLPSSEPYYKPVNVSNITEDNALITAICHNPDGIPLKTGGFYLRKKGDTSVIKKTDNIAGSYQTMAEFNCSYNLKNEYGITLEPGTTYEYRLYVADASKKEYPTTIWWYEFTTAGNASGDPNASISAADYLKNYAQKVTAIDKTAVTVGNAPITAWKLPWTNKSDASLKLTTVSGRIKLINEVINHVGNIWYEYQTGTGTRGFVYHTDVSIETAVPFCTEDKNSDPTEDNAVLYATWNNPSGMRLSYGGFRLGTDPNNLTQYREKVASGYETAKMIPCSYDLKNEYGIELRPNSTYYYQFFIETSDGVLYESDEMKSFELDHVHIYTEQTTEPSCTEEGYTTYTCACGESYKDNYAPAMGHTEVIDEAVHVTCVQNGLTEGSHCSVCGETLVKQEVIEAIGHEFGEWDTVVEPTEDAEGKAVRQCPLCNETEEKVLPKLDHVHIYAEQTTEPSCTEEGYTTYTCACGESYKDNYAPAMGHTEVIDEAVHVTCVQNGLTEGSHCSVCGETLVKQEVIEAIGHEFGEWDTVVEPTEDTEGKAVRQCPLCNETEEKVLSKLDHVHIYTEQTTEPTCTEEGYTIYTCKCGESYTDNYVPAIGHTEVIDEAVHVTCVQNGLTEGSHCSVCGETLVKQEVIEAIGHEFGEWDTVVEPTEDAEGKAVRQCPLCNETEEKVLPKLDHVHSYTEKIIEPTCTEQGYTTYTCACGESYKDNYVPATGHIEVIDEAIASTCDKAGLTEGKHCSVCKETLIKQEVVRATGHEFGEWKTVVEPTEEDEGKAVRQCQKCDETEEKPLPKLEHVHNYTEQLTAPTCTEKGYTTYICKCGDSYVDNYTEATDHTWDNGKVTTTPTNKEDGVRTYTCTRCGDTKTEVIPATGEEILWGDASGDGRVNAMDATRILRFAAKLITEDKIDLTSSDVNGDGRVNAMDATRILRYVAKLIPTLRVEK